MSNLLIVNTPDGRALEHDGQQVMLPALPVDAVVHAYTTPNGLWYGVQLAGNPRPVPPGAGSRRLGEIELPADEAVAARHALDHAKVDKISEINAAYTAAVDPLIREYPEPEPLSWAHQDAEAQAYLAWHSGGAQGDAPATPVLDQILAGRNGDDGTETMLELCEAVERNAVAFRQSQVLTGKRQRLVRLVREAESIEEVEAVEWG